MNNMAEVLCILDGKYFSVTSIGAMEKLLLNVISALINLLAEQLWQPVISSDI